MRISGIVEKGLGIAGPHLGAPTANLRLTAPPDMPRGVYAAFAYLEDEPYPAVVCYGADERRRKFEVHIIDWSGELYDAPLTVEVVEKIRDLVPWESVDQMRQCIADDLVKAKDILRARL